MNINLAKMVKRITAKLIAVLIFFASVPSLSAVPYRNAFQEIDLINSETQELNLNLLAKIQILIDENRVDLARYIPLRDIPQTDNGGKISQRIFEQTLETLIDSLSAQDSKIIRQAQTINSGFSSSVDRNGYSVKFRIKPVNTTAEVSYEGVVRAALAYDVSHSEAKIEFSKKVGEQTYAYTHTNVEGGTDSVGVRWSF